MNFDDEFIKETIRRASEELDEEECEKEKGGGKDMIPETLRKIADESILAEEALEIKGAIRGGEGDLYEDIKDSEPRKKRKYTKKAEKAGRNKATGEEEQHDNHARIPQAVKETLERELLHISEEQLRLEKREAEIVEFIESLEGKKKW